MDKNRKRYIDNLWKNTEYGQLILLSASGKKEEAVAIAEKIVSKPPFSLDAVEKELSAKIAGEIKNTSEFDEYMKALDAENYDLVEFMISNDTFGIVYDLLNN